MYAMLGLAAAFVFAASPAFAQYQPRPMNSPATGETYHIEASAGFWYPSATIVVSSESLQIEGSNIDFKEDLGLTDHRLPELQLQLRPARKHKFRFQYIPITYDQSAVLKQDIVFNGQRYRLGLPVNSTLDWKAYRFGYEYDFVARDRGFAGLILEAKYTNVTATLKTPIVGLNEFDRARLPIPAIGGIARVYLAPSFSVTGELTGFKLPKKLVKDATGHYVDLDIYGTYNFSDHIGAQAGYRSLDLGYGFELDSGALTLKGLYFGVVLRY